MQLSMGYRGLMSGFLICALMGLLPGMPAVAADASKDQPLTIRGIDYGKAPERIAFGSGANQNEDQPIWKGILQQDPDAFIFMGGAVDLTKGDGTANEQYKKLNRIPEYRQFREKVPFLAIWDDADYGTVNGGADASTKDSARKEFLGYWNYVRDSLPFNRDGLYHAKILGGAVTGKKRRQKVNGPSLQVILLDTRTFRSPLKKGDDGAFIPNTDKGATLLGPDQWEWLEDHLRQSANFRILVSPIPVIATQPGGEKWSLFPAEREKLFNLLKKTGVKNLVILSGNRHVGSIAKTEVKGWGKLYDVTSGSLNQPSKSTETDKEFLGNSINAENFGLATFDWKHKSLKVELRDIDGKPANGFELKFR